jgi:hypothetical protein
MTSTVEGGELIICDLLLAIYHFWHQIEGNSALLKPKPPESINNNNHSQITNNHWWAFVFIKYISVIALNDA